MIYYILILLGILTRILPHAWNFTSVAAIALFSGYYIKNKKIAFAVPIAVMLLSDWKIGFYQWQIMASVYASFAVVVLFGVLIKNKKWYFAFPTSLVGTIIFFFVTNYAVWQFGTWYPHTFAGLTECIVAGIPFIKNSFAGDLIYTFVLFSVAELAVYFAKKTNPSVAKIIAGDRI
jgi:hypothetical protein